MRSLSVRFLFSFLVLIAVPALAHDVTLTGTSSFASLDGSSSDHDGAVNGVFSVNDGNLVVNGVVNCNDDTATNACAMTFSVSGNMTVNAGGALYAENRTGSGVGGAVTLNVGGNFALNGNAIVSTSSKSSSGSQGGAITANVIGSVALASGSTIDSGSANAAGGAISITSASGVTVDGNVLSGPTRTLLASRLGPGAALDGGTSNTGGGSISISSSTFVEPAIVVGATANIVSQGADNGAGPITIDGCGIQVRGLIAALSAKAGSGSVRIRSGKDLLVDGRDLGATGARMGRIRADAPSGTAVNKGVDVFAAETIDLLGPAAGSIYLITSLPGAHDTKSYGGTIRVTSTEDAVNGSGRLIDDGHSASGDTGGNVSIAASGNVSLDTAAIRAHGDFNTNNSNRGGGSITIRSYSGNITWTNGLGEVRPVGSTSGLAPADQGKIVLTACGTINTTGTSFPVEGVATSVFPETSTGVCSPSAASLPTGVPPLVTCNTPPVANDTAASTLEDTTVTITLSGTDADGDSLTFSIVSGPANGSLGPVVPTSATTATVDYTPNLNYNGADAFVFRANDGNGGTDDATATITIAAVNDSPSFLAGATVTSLEDAGAQSQAGWASAISAGPADESGQTVTFTVTNSNNALFSVQPAVSSSGTLTYTAAPNAYGSATITVVAQDNGGTANGGSNTSAPQSSTITITGVNDEPSFTGSGNQAVSEDAPAFSASWITASSAGPNESQSITYFTSNDNNALFTAQPAIATDGTLSFTLAADANGSATVSVYAQDDGGTANGGDDTSATQTFTIAVTAVNDTPSFTSGGNVTVLEDSGAYSAAWATNVSAGPADESTQIVHFTITGNTNAALFSVPPSIAQDGTLSFSVVADAFGTATISVNLADSGDGANTSATQTFDIIVSNVNDAPAFSPGSGTVTVNEDSAAYSASWASSISAGAGESGQALTFVVSNDSSSLFAAQPAISASGVLTFTPAANQFGTANVTVYLQDDGGTANGGSDTSATVTFQIVVNSVNDAPTFSGGGNVTVDEDSGAYSAPWASGMNAGPFGEGGQSATFLVTGNTNPALFAASPAVAPDGTLTFTPASSASGSASITVVLQDNGGTANGGVDTSTAVTFTITVNNVNDPPSFTPGGNVTVNEDSGAYLNSWATSLSAGPGESQPLTFTVTNDNNALFSAQPSINPGGVLTFTPAPNAFGSANVTVTLSDGIDSTSPVSFVITVNGVNDPPSASSDSWETEGNTELRVDLAAGLTPSVNDTTPSGTGVAHNDVDSVEGDPFTVTGIVGCADVVAPYVCPVAGGTVRMNANGSFSYQPNAGATAGSFQYEVTDQPAAGTPASSTGTVTIVIHDRIWYVNGGASFSGNGTSSAPFNSLAALNGIGDPDGVGDYIFVHTSTVTGGIELEGAQKLWGEGVGLIIPRNLNGNGSPATLVAPGANAIITAATGDTVTVGDVANVEVAGLNLLASAGNGIDVTSTSAATSATIYSNVITAGAEGIDVNGDGGFGTSVVVHHTNILSTGNGIDVTTLDGANIAAISDVSVTSLGGNGIVVDGTAGGTLTLTSFGNLTVSGNTTGDGIVVSSATFDAVPGGSFNALTGNVTVGSAGNPVGGAGVVLTNVSGDYAIGALTVRGGTTGVTVNGTGLFTGAAGMRISSTSGLISADAGSGLAVSNTTIGAANLTLTSISSTGGANGIVLNNTGATGGLKVLGSGVAASGGTVQNTSGDGISLRSTVDVSLAWMEVRNAAHNGVKGTRVSGFAFTNGSVANTGTAAAGAAKEGGIVFNDSVSFTENNVDGVVSITNSSISGVRRNAIEITNWDGTISSLTISGNTLTSSTSAAASLGHAIQILAQGSAASTASVTRADILNNGISNFPSGSGIFVAGGNPGGPSPFTMGVPNTSDAITISGNQIAGASAALRMGGSAIAVSTNGCNGQSNFVIRNNGTSANPLTNFGGIGISHFVAGTVNATALIDGNVIVANNTAGSAGIATQVDQICGVADAAMSAVTISNNLVSGTEGNGIRGLARASNGTLNLRVTGNTVSAPTLANRNGIRIDSGSATGDVSVCLEISNNASAGSGVSKGIALRKQGTNATINSFGVVGMAATSTPGVEAYVNSQNPAGGATELISATTGFTNCSL
jgi:hypothetical protein